MEIRVDTYMEDFQGTRKPINRAYLTLVAVDSNNVPGKVSAFLLVIIGNSSGFLYHKKPSGQDAHLAEVKLAVNGTARARRMRRAHSFLTEVAKAEWETAKSRKELRIQRQKEGF